MPATSSDARIYAMGFRRMADEIDRLRDADRALATEPDRLEYCLNALAIRKVDDHAGRLVIDAVEKGFLRSIPNLLELVNWAQGRGRHPTDLAAEGSPGAEKMQAVLARCPANVFHELRGNHQVKAWIKPDGGIGCAKESSGGVLPARYPGLLPPHKGAGSVANKLEHSARVCLSLAEMIEAEAQQAHGNVATVQPAAEIATGRTRPREQTAPPEGGYAGIGDIMVQFSISQLHYATVDGRLKRFRKRNAVNSRAFTQHDARAKNEPTYLYNLSMVEPLLKDLVDATDTAPNGRPTIKK